MQKTHLIIGTSAAGISAANKLRQLDPACEIICVSDEVELPYNKCYLADYLAGLKQEQQVFTLTEAQAEQKNFQLLLNKRVAAIHASEKRITLSDGQHIAYDSLMIGVGASPVVPTLPGATLAGVFTFHRLRDMQAIQAYIQHNKVKKVVVVGAGLTGLECADALVVCGLQVAVIERAPQLLHSLVDDAASQFIEGRMRQAGVALNLASSVQEVVGDLRVSAVRLADGSVHDADMVIFAVGVRSNVELAQATGIKCTAAGITIDTHMQTNLPGIFAAGDVCAVRDLLTGHIVPSRTWPDAMFQGMMAAHAMALAPKPYAGVTMVISSHFFDVKFVTCGSVINPPAAYEVVVRTGDDYYHKYLIENGFLKGFLLVGNTSILAKLRPALMMQTKILPLI